MKFKKYLMKSKLNSFVKKINDKFEGSEAMVTGEGISIYSNDKNYLDQIKKWIENTLPVKTKVIFEYKKDILKVKFGM